MNDAEKGCLGGHYKAGDACPGCGMKDPIACPLLPPATDDPEVVAAHAASRASYEREQAWERWQEGATARVSDESRNGQDRDSGLEGEAPPARPSDSEGRPLPPPPSLTQGDEA